MTLTFRGIPRFWVTVRVRGFLDVVLLVEVEVLVVVEVVVVIVQIPPDDPSNIPSLSAVEVSHAPQRVCAKDDASENICSMLVTLETSHLEMSPLNNEALENMAHMLVTLDTSHLERSLLNDAAV